MEILIDTLKHLMDPDWIMRNGGLFLVLIILLIETGLFFGFFLPGDPLLFVSGMVIASAEEIAFPFGNNLVNLGFWCFLFSISTIIGNYIGYWTGHKFGHIFVTNERKSWLVKPKHIESAQEFYKKRGGFAILIARFLPVVRTFVPIVGGIVKMDIKRFSTFNILGALLWVGTLTTLGFVLGENAWVQENLEWTMLGLVLVVTFPVIMKLFVKKRPSIQQKKSFI